MPNPPSSTARAFNGFAAEDLNFLTGLAAHNDKVWFEEHRAVYDDRLKPAMSGLIATLNTEFAARELPFVGDQKNIFRIHRDVRFSKDTRRAFAAGVDANAILNDPETPVSGNPKGDLTIVAFLDYNCPFCKRSEPELLRLVKADGRIRLVHKDWPILGDSSVYGAQLALAAKYQDRYGEAHAALMAIPAGNTPKERMLEAVSTSGVDMVRLQEDQKAHQAEIAALLQRNLDQADDLGLEGTPVFLVGPLKVAAALDYDGFRKAAAQARARSRS